jgi:hypothetical protein
MTTCKREATYELPEISDQFIALTLDGQEQILRSITNYAFDATSFYIDEAAGSNSLSLFRNSRDNAFRLELTAQDLPIRGKESGFVYDGEEFTPAIIGVIGSEMSGSIYCPHEIDGIVIEYQLLIRFDDWDESGRMRGAFKTDPSAENQVEITNGRFELDVRRR